MARERLWTPLFVSLIGVALCCFVVAQGLNAGTSVYLEQLGNTAALSGIMAVAFSLSAAASRLLSGPLIDKGNRFALMIAGCAMLSVGTLAGVISSHGVVLAACRALQGIGFSVATTAASTLASTVLPRSRVGEGIGYYGLGQALAMSIGPAFALYLVDTDPSTNMFLGVGAVAVLATVGAVACLVESKSARLPETSVYYRQQHGPKREGACAATAAKESRPPAHEQGFIRRFIEPAALPGALPQALIAANVGFGIYYAGLYGTLMGIAAPGLFFTISALSMVAVRLSSHLFMDRVAPLKVFGVAVLAGLATYALLLACPSLPLLYYAAGFFYGICLGISLPLNQSVAVKASPVERWGSANALFLLANDLGIGLSAVLWGFASDAWGFPVTLVCVMVCIAASFLVARAVYPRAK